ncbi:MAG TPA: phosphate ABC transporter substrate-binding protein [Nitrospiria bacterium]
MGVKISFPIGLGWGLFLFLVSGCSNQANTEHLIRMAGSSTVLPIATKAAEKFRESQSGVKITVSPGGSGVGVRSLGNGLIDIGMVSRTLSEEERVRFPTVKFISNVIAKDAVAVVVSSEIYDAGVTELSGEINNWKELGGPDREILCIDKEVHRGTRHVFMEYFFNDPTGVAKGADIVSGSNNEELTKITLSDSAIGMLSAAWANQDVKDIGLKNNGKTVYPTKENIRNGVYPISRDLIFLTNGEPRGKVKGFIDFLLGEAGQKIIEESGYVSLH